MLKYKACLEACFSASAKKLKRKAWELFWDLEIYVKHSRICILDSNSCFTFFLMGCILNVFFWISNWQLCKFMSILCLGGVVEYVWFDFLKALRSLIIVEALSLTQGFKAATAFFNSPYYRQNLKLIGMFEFECLEIIPSKISEVMIWTPFISKNQS